MSGSRTILAVTGSDREDFLQGLVTNDVTKLKTGPVYAALLSPQGKYLADFFLIADGPGILMDVATDLAPALLKRLNMYRLRADVQISETELTASRGTGPTPPGAYPDPRHPELGWRAYDGRPSDETDWTTLNVAHIIPQTGIELIPETSYILEMGFERLNGVDFKKGCYVGQEVTARMKHKTALRKGLAQVLVDGQTTPGTPIEHDGKAIGTIFSQSKGKALAYLRFDRAGENMQAGAARVTLAAPPPNTD